jgi:AraC family transcriptional regulator
MMQASDAVSPVLTHIQANLGGDLALEALARRAGYSPFHFHRVFEAAVGETVKAYTQRLRLERAAFRFLFHDETILEIAAECGFARPETFTRAFRRHFGKPPSAFRAAGRELLMERAGAVQPVVPEGEFALSPTRLVQIRPINLAFIRQVGRYEDVDATIFDELVTWHAARGGLGQPLLFGLGHDAPGTTAPDRLRFDAAIRVPAPFEVHGRIAHQLLPGGLMAMTSHAGAAMTLKRAYGEIFARLMAMDGIRIIGLPVVEAYHSARAHPHLSLTSTDIYIPVERPKA